MSTNSTITAQHQAAIATFMSTFKRPSSLGSEELARSIAEIELFAVGRLTDDISNCVSATAVRANHWGALDPCALLVKPAEVDE